MHDPAPMIDVQNWVKTDAHQILFLYGQYDPWSGGAYELGMQPDVTKLVAPKMNHAAMITSLSPADRDIALGKIEQWIGTRPRPRHASHHASRASDPPVRARDSGFLTAEQLL